MQLFNMLLVERRRCPVRHGPSFDMSQGIQGHSAFDPNRAIHRDETNQLPVCIVFGTVQIESQIHVGLSFPKSRSIQSLAGGEAILYATKTWAGLLSLALWATRRDTWDGRRVGGRNLSETMVLAAATLTLPTVIAYRAKAPWNRCIV